LHNSSNSASSTSLTPKTIAKHEVVSFGTAILVGVEPRLAQSWLRNDDDARNLVVEPAEGLEAFRALSKTRNQETDRFVLTVGGHITQSNHSLRKNSNVRW